MNVLWAYRYAAFTFCCRGAETLLLEPKTTLRVPGHDSHEMCCDWQRQAPFAEIAVGCYDGIVAPDGPWFVTTPSYDYCHPSHRCRGHV